VSRTASACERTRGGYPLAATFVSAWASSVAKQRRPLKKFARRVVPEPAGRAEARRRVAAEIVERQAGYTSVSTTDTTNGITKPIAGTFSACVLPHVRGRVISARHLAGAPRTGWPCPYRDGLAQP